MKSLQGKKLLVVEDDDLLREVLVDLFGYTKAEVLQAANGTEALKLIKDFHIDAVISDVRMPGGDGIQLAKNIQNLVGRKPLLFICSGFSDLTEEVALELDVIKVFAKPFNRDDLTNAVIDSLQKTV